MKKIAITLCATEKYTYAIDHLAQRILSNVGLVRDVSVSVHFVTDQSQKGAEAAAILARRLKSVCEVQTITLPLIEDGIPYKEQAQLRLAKMQGELFHAARAAKPDYCWMIEADVLPPANALRCLLGALDFDGGYYDVAFATYPSQGGGAFLGGRGSPMRHIEEDYLPEERELPAALVESLAARKIEQSAFAEKKEPYPEEWLEAGRKLDEEVKKCPPKGNVWKLNADFGWRQRGWLDQAYPAIGRGAILPTDWVGLGCTLLSAQALALSDFDGYEGKGTQDLFLCWRRWQPGGLRLCVLPHVPCDHVIRERNEDGSWDFTKLTLVKAFHEEVGASVGHLRQMKVPFFPA